MVISTNGCNVKLSPPGGTSEGRGGNYIHVGPQVSFDGQWPLVPVILSLPMRPQEAMLTTLLQRLPGCGAHQW